jgi:hypothetical protein
MSDPGCLHLEMPGPARRAALLFAIVPIIVLVLDFFKGPIRSSFIPYEKFSRCFKFQRSYRMEISIPPSMGQFTD